MAKTTNKTLYIKRFTTKDWLLKFTKSNSALDNTDWTIFFTVKSSKNDTDANAVISKDITSHSNPTEGKTLISLTTSDTTLDIGSYWYDIKYKDDDGKQGILLEGKFEVKQPTTRRTS